MRKIIQLRLIGYDQIVQKVLIKKMEKYLTSRNFRKENRKKYAWQENVIRISLI